MFGFILFNTLTTILLQLTCRHETPANITKKKCQEYSHMSFDLESCISTMSGVTNVNPPAPSASRRHVTCFDAVHVFSPKLASSQANVSISDNDPLFTSTVQRANRSSPTTLQNRPCCRLCSVFLCFPTHVAMF